MRRHVRRPRIRRQSRPCRLALHRLRRRRPAARLQRRRSEPAVAPAVDAVIIGSGPGGSAAADVLTAAGWSVVIFEKGRNHLIDLDDPTRLGTEYSNDEIKFMTRHFLGPDPLLEPRTFRVGDDDGDRAFVGDVNNLP